MKKYSIEEKQRAVEMVKEGQSVRTVSRQTGISRKVLEYVLAQVDKHGWSSLEGHRYNWSAEEKLSILQYMENNHLSCFETGIHFDIKGSSTVRVWAERYRRDGMAGLESKKQGRPKKWRPPDETMTREEQLEAENLYLRAENAYLKKLRALIAEEERQERERKQQSSRN